MTPSQEPPKEDSFDNPESIDEKTWNIGLEEATEYDYPAKFKIIIHNDHYTSMEFVIEILMTFFHKTRTDAEALMLKVHSQGHAIAGVYPREVAESKVRDVEKLAQKNEYPLRLSMEKT